MAVEDGLVGAARDVSRAWHLGRDVSRPMQALAGALAEHDGKGDEHGEGAAGRGRNGQGGGHVAGGDCQ